MLEESASGNADAGEKHSGLVSMGWGGGKGSRAMYGVPRVPYESG